MVEADERYEGLSGAGSLSDPHDASLFRGSGQYAIDDKGRLTLPLGLRKPLLDGGNLTVLDGRAVLWNERTFRRAVDTLNEQVTAGDLDQRQVRLFLASVHTVQPDAQGRIVLPPRVRTMAGLDRDVVVAGAGPRIEIWPAGAYEYEMEIAQDESVTNALDRAGF